jgi:hypothetical protein
VLIAFFERIAKNAWLKADAQHDYPVHVTEQGHDLQQLVQKLLVMGVAFSQGTDDYLDDDKEGKGILVDNLKPAEAGKPYTALEHHWDEAFGYFGAAADYNDYTDAEIASPGYKDSNKDQKIDLLSEFNFGASSNAAKRDVGSASTAKTDFTKAIFDAFLQGRTIISSAAGPLSESKLTELKEQRDIIVLNWEKAISATLVHYINSVLQHMNRFGDEEAYKFLYHAKHWSEMKGFALGLQFNPRSPLTAAKFAEFHTLVGDAPVLKDADEEEIANYKHALRLARAILKEAYGFADANLGDADGKNGW